MLPILDGFPASMYYMCIYTIFRYLVYVFANYYNRVSCATNSHGTLHYIIRYIYGIYDNHHQDKIYRTYVGT